MSAKIEKISGQYKIHWLTSESGKQLTVLVQIFKISSVFIQGMETTNSTLAYVSTSHQFSSKMQ